MSAKVGLVTVGHTKEFGNGIRERLNKSRDAKNSSVELDEFALVLGINLTRSSSPLGHAGVGDFPSESMLPDQL
jgi:hypothetical protein